MSQPILTTCHLDIGYARGARRWVVGRGIEVSLGAGEMVCLLGPNGAGKSTLLRTLAGLQPALAGQALLDGRDVAGYDRRALARSLAVVLTERRLPGLMTARDLVSLGRYPYTGLSGALDAAGRRIVQESLDIMGAAALADRPVGQLSDGERQKVVIARALAQDPRVLILDEPTAFLDLPRRVSLMRKLRELARRTGKGIALSTHDLDLALRSADRLWLMGGGTLIEGGPEDLVLDGSFERVFAGDDIDFDRNEGAFRIHPHTSGAARLDGAGPEAAWTTRALQREGFRVVAEGDAHVTVTVMRQGEGTLWIVTDGAGRYECQTLAELATVVRRDLPAVNE